LASSEQSLALEPLASVITPIHLLLRTPKEPVLFHLLKPSGEEDGAVLAVSYPYKLNDPCS
jgi:hypothetical protein